MSCIFKSDFYVDATLWSHFLSSLGEGYTRQKMALYVKGLTDYTFSSNFVTSGSTVSE